MNNNEGTTTLHRKSVSMAYILDTGWQNTYCQAPSNPQKKQQQ